MRVQSPDASEHVPVSPECIRAPRPAVGDIPATAGTGGPDGGTLNYRKAGVGARAHARRVSTEVSLVLDRRRRRRGGPSLPRPAFGQLHLEAKAEEPADGDDAGQHPDAG